MRWLLVGVVVYVTVGVVSATAVLVDTTRRDDPSGVAGLAALALAVVLVPAWPLVVVWAVHYRLRERRLNRQFHRQSR
jgi:hypothetical protein